jgi:hypothetical protein
MSVKHSIILTSCVVGCAVTLTLFEPGRVVAQSAVKLIVGIDQSTPGTSNGVYVTNAPSVSATISGTPSVNATINGTPTVNVGNSAIAVTLPPTRPFATRLATANKPFDTDTYLNDSGSLVVIELINGFKCDPTDGIIVQTLHTSEGFLFTGRKTTSGCFNVSELTRIYVSPGELLSVRGSPDGSATDTVVQLVGHYEQ